jgi:hypothetical protein
MGFLNGPPVMMKRIQLLRDEPYRSCSSFISDKLVEIENVCFWVSPIDHNINLQAKVPLGFCWGAVNALV